MSSSNCSIHDMGEGQKQQLIAYLSTIINEQRQQLLQDILSRRTRHITIVLEDIYQAQNASAVVRTAECLGLQELHIIENMHDYKLNSQVVKGASKWMELYRHKKKDRDNTRICLEKLKSRGYKIVAMTLQEDSIDINTLALDQKMAVCFGSEKPGLTQQAHALADEYVKIPMSGFTQSFNLSVSAGIALHYLTTKMRDSNINWQLDEEDKTQLYINWLSWSTPTGKVLLDEFIKSNFMEV